MEKLDMKVIGFVKGRYVRCNRIVAAVYNRLGKGLSFHDISNPLIFVLIFQNCTS